MAMLHEYEEWRQSPLPIGKFQAMRQLFGMPKRVIRLSAAHLTRASVF